MLRQHRRAWQKSWQLYRSTPWRSNLLCLTLALCFILPLGLQVMTKHLHTLSNRWDTGATATLFLQMDATQTQVTSLVRTLAANPLTLHLTHQTPAQALDAFAQEVAPQIGLTHFSQNPLPHLIILSLKEAPATDIDAFKATLENMPVVDDVLLDTTWVHFLQHLITLSQNVMHIMGILFSGLAIVVICHTLQLHLAQHEQTMSVMSLIGATKAYVRRPYLYYGVIIGALSSLLSVLAFSILGYIFLQYIDWQALQLPPIPPQTLLSAVESLQFIVLCALLGWLAARIATHKIAV